MSDPRKQTTDFKALISATGQGGKCISMLKQEKNV